MKSYESKRNGIIMVVVGIICAILAISAIITGETLRDKNSMSSYKRSEDTHNFWLQVGSFGVASVIATGKGILIIKKARQNDNS